MTEQVLSEELPYIFGRVELWRIGRQGQEGDVFRDGEPTAGLMPSRSIENDDGMGAVGNAFCNLGQMQGHGFGIDLGEHQGCSRATLGSNGAEEINRTMARIAGRWRPGAASRPKAGERSLLADTTVPAPGP